MHVAVEKLRDRIEEKMRYAMENCSCCSEELKKTMGEWIETRHSTALNREVLRPSRADAGGLRLRYVQGAPVDEG